MPPGELSPPPVLLRIPLVRVRPPPRIPVVGVGPLPRTPLEVVRPVPWVPSVGFMPPLDEPPVVPASLVVAVSPLPVVSPLTGAPPPPLPPVLPFTKVGPQPMVVSIVRGLHSPSSLGARSSEAPAHPSKVKQASANALVVIEAGWWLGSVRELCMAWLSMGCRVHLSEFSRGMRQTRSSH